MSLNLKDLDDAEQFQKHFVVPMVEAVRNEIAPLVKASEDHEKRLKGLEGNQKKALIGYGAMTVVASSVFAVTKDWIKRKLGY